MVLGGALSGVIGSSDRVVATGEGGGTLGTTRLPEPPSSASSNDGKGAGLGDRAGRVLFDSGLSARRCLFIVLATGAEI